MTIISLSGKIKPACGLSYCVVYNHKHTRISSSSSEQFATSGCGNFKYSGNIACDT